MTIDDLLRKHAAITDFCEVSISIHNLYDLIHEVVENAAQIAEDSEPDDHGRLTVQDIAEAIRTETLK